MTIRLVLTTDAQADIATTDDENRFHDVGIVYTEAGRNPFSHVRASFSFPNNCTGYGGR